MLISPFSLFPLSYGGYFLVKNNLMYSPKEATADLVENTEKSKSFASLSADVRTWPKCHNCG